MRVLKVLALAGALTACFAGQALALEVKASGQWDFSFGYYGNRTHYDADHGPKSNSDPFAPIMRVRPMFEFKASESVTAVLGFEIGDIFFGQNPGDGTGSGSGGQLDADGVNIETRRAYLDWEVPGTPARVRMGIQNMRFPGVVAGNPLMNADVMGVAASAQLTDNVGVTLSWARPYDVSATDEKKNLFDEMDFGILAVPIKTPSVRVTPWLAGGSVGKDTTYNNASAGALAPTASNHSTRAYRGRWVPADKRYDQSAIWWAGTAFELPLVSPFIVKLDAMYGEQDAKGDFNTRGYFTAWQLGYKASWATNSLIGWYSSGDGKGRSSSYGTIPVVSDDAGWGMTSFGMNGQRGTNRDKAISGQGIGMWGLGVEVKDISFTQDLSHLLRFMVMRGTNSGDRINANTPLYTGDGGGNSRYFYMVSTDTAYEANFENTYQVSKNLEIGLDFAYIHLDLSKQRSDNWRNTEDSWAAILSFQYKY